MNNNQIQNNVLKAKYQKKYNAGRSFLIGVAAFTIINVLLTAANADIYFLFSAQMPYMLVLYAMLFTGKLPPEFYEGEFANIEFLNPSLFGVAVVIAIALTALYFVAWLLSSKKRGWMTFALVYFCVDTLYMFVMKGFDVTIIIDIAFHAWVIVILAIAVSASYKLKQLEKQEEANCTTVEGEEVFDLNNIDDNGVYHDPNQDENMDQPANAPILRVADQQVKNRVFLQYEFMGHQIVYRRVKKTNELVIDGNVYAEYVAVVELSHSLGAMIDGHYIEVGSRGSQMFVAIDGNDVITKIRWI